MSSHYSLRKKRLSKINYLTSDVTSSTSYSEDTVTSSSSKYQPPKKLDNILDDSLMDKIIETTLFRNKVSITVRARVAAVRVKYKI